MDFKNIDPVRTGKFIRILRKAHNLTQDQLGEKLFITRKAVSKWETGRACPSIDMLKLLSETLGVSLEDIIEGDFEKLEALLANNDNIVYKTVHSEDFKLSGKILCSFALFILVTFFILNFNATKVYSVTYEDDTFGLDNGSIVLSNIRSYVDLGTFYTNEKNVDTSLYKFELYLDKENENIFILEYTAGKMVDIPKNLSKIIKKDLSKKNTTLYLKVTHLGSNTINNLKLKVVEKEDPDLNRAPDKVFADMIFGPYETDALFKKVKENFKSTEEMTMSEIPEFIDLSFLYEMDIEKIKNKFSDSAFKDGNNEIHIIFDIENNWLNVFVNDNKIEFCFKPYGIKINNSTFYRLDLTYSLFLKDSQFDEKEYKMIYDTVKYLKNL